MTALLEARGLVKRFPARPGVLRRSRAAVPAVDGVDLDLREGECLALVGESGSGKTTLGRILARLVEPDAGSLRFAGEDLLALRGAALRRKRRELQVIFQDPWTSLHPRMRVGAALREPLAVHRIVPPEWRAERVAELLGLVGLDPGLARRYPHQLSGGQRQRVGIARALAVGPRLLIADEPVSALDASVRAQVLGLLADLRRRLGLTLLLIAHDLALVGQVADRVAVMYLGRVVEIGSRDDLFAAPRHPYTATLLDSAPVPQPGSRPRALLAGEPADLLDMPPGCRFHPRCPLFHEMLRRAGPAPCCAMEEPALAASPAGRAVACHYPGEWKLLPRSGVSSGRAAEAGRAGPG